MHSRKDDQKNGINKLAVKGWVLIDEKKLEKINKKNLTRNKKSL